MTTDYITSKGLVPHLETSVVITRPSGRENGRLEEIAGVLKLENQVLTVNGIPLTDLDKVQIGQNVYTYSAPQDMYAF
jgi:hypothetical protein